MCKTMYETGESRPHTIAALTVLASCVPTAAGALWLDGGIELAPVFPSQAFLPFPSNWGRNWASPAR